ncbi:hypothetical protein AB0G85_37070 [Streptomyces sioyaensis]|uniref:hypothetical protein n=1 Tax=Streptomyces sioyaensis TaxID=67364 RepID=UPI0033C2CE79
MGTLMAIGGGPYPWWVDAAVYLAVAASVGAPVLGAVQAMKIRHGGRLPAEQEQ